MRRPKEDQFAAELAYFSNCVLKNIEPEPSGEEGLADVRIIQALYESARIGRPVSLSRFARRQRPDLRQKIKRPPAKPPPSVYATVPTKEENK